MSTEASPSGCPGLLAEINQQDNMIEADLERGGHGTETVGIGRDVAGFDRRPFGGLHAGQPGRFFQGTADGFAALPDHSAEDLPPGTAADG